MRHSISTRVKKLDYHRRCLTKNLDGTWKWDAPIWFGKGFFADCVVSSRKPNFPTQRDAEEDMVKVLKNFGINLEKPFRKKYGKRRA